MDPSVLFLLLLNYAFMACLPTFFFRRTGRIRPAWWLTGFHFGYVPASLLVGYFSPVPGLFVSVGRLGPTLEAAAVLLSALSIGVLAAALGSHRVRLAQWHQDVDPPVEIVSWGPYARIRHPFYAGYILAALGVACLAPGPATLAGAIGTILALNLTAAREERRLLASDLGQDYARYVGRTGRFMPKPQGHHHDN